MLATNQNVGGSIAPRIFPHLMGTFGWESALIGPAIVTLLYATVMSFMLRSSPVGEATPRASMTRSACSAANLMPATPDTDSGQQLVVFARSFDLFDSCSTIPVYASMHALLLTLNDKPLIQLLAMNDKLIQLPAM